MSLIIFGLSLVFMLLKCRHLMEQQNPSIATFDQELELGADNAFELDDEDFMLAFGIDHYKEGLKNDERYIKWIARHKLVSAEGETTWRYFPVYNCTQSDFDRFYEPALSSQRKIR